MQAITEEVLRRAVMAPSALLRRITDTVAGGGGRFTLHMAAGQVLYEAPALDDSTFIFAHAHARVLAWRVLR